MTVILFTVLLCFPADLFIIIDHMKVIFNEKLWSCSHIVTTLSRIQGPEQCLNVYQKEYYKKPN
jgi:hypothetical protein